jgi:uracil-DNA glycosylase
VPRAASLEAVADSAKTCRACSLYKNATQTVFGEGPARARIVLVGEQPGDAEDLAGHPFVGPAGALLDRALEAAGLDRASLYLTNAVKHFSWKPGPERGKRRIHKKPRMSEIKACRPWLDEELARIKPAVVVCLGATAVQALLGPRVTIASARNQAIETAHGPVIVTRHPAAVLRAIDREERKRGFDELVADLRRASALTKKR